MPSLLSTVYHENPIYLYNIRVKANLTVFHSVQ